MHILFDRQSFLVQLTVCLGLVFLVAGCGGDDGPVYAKVTGKVTLNGKPVPNGTVLFVPQGDTQGGVATGAIAKDGTFTLVGPSGKGVPVGKHKVLVQCIEESSGPDSDQNPLEGMAKCVIPVKYTSEKTSDIIKTVEEGEQTINIELKK
ncbi:MAG: hypothetical protein Tsb009_05400 [Planctomycetaceae bacterium]